MVGIDNPVKDSIMKIYWNFAITVADFILLNKIMK